MYSLNNKSFKIVLQISEIDGAIFDTFPKRGSYSWFPLYRFLRCQPPPSWNRMYVDGDSQHSGFSAQPICPLLTEELLFRILRNLRPI